MFVKTHLLLLAASTALICFGQAPLNAEDRQIPEYASVPLVGCPADGVGGPVKAPLAGTVAVTAPAEPAGRLAYYTTQDQAAMDHGVLAPLDWQCGAINTATGTTLYVAPEPVNLDQLMHYQQTFSGPVVMLSVTQGTGDGKAVVEEFIGSFLNQLPAPKDPADPKPLQQFGTNQLEALLQPQITIREFEMPPGQNVPGPGSNTAVEPNQQPIHGVAIVVGPTPDLILVEARLPHLPQGLSTSVKPGPQAQTSQGQNSKGSDAQTNESQTLLKVILDEAVTDHGNTP